MSGHVHAAIMAEYAEVARTSTTPWSEFEAKGPEDVQWDGLDWHPSWTANVEYRRKPSTILLGDVEIPAPLKVAPSIGSKYYIPSLTVEQGAHRQYWDGADYDLLVLSRGLVHSTEEAAKLHAKALLSFTEAE